MISQYENGYRIPRATTIFRLAEAVGVDPAFLVAQPASNTRNSSYARGYYDGYRAALKALSANVQALRKTINPPSEP